jgi:hypothetical protein
LADFMSAAPTNADDVEIQLKGPTTPSEVLGVWTCPASTGDAQQKHMVTKGQKWSKRILASPLRPAEVWHSFRTQAIPAVTYGLMTLMMPRHELDDTFMKWYYSFLPSLGVNRNITREWRILPTSYQGLGLPQMSLEKLAMSIQYFQRHWGCVDEVGQALRSVFELTQIEVGLSGNFLLHDYKMFRALVTHSWFKILWEYPHHYKDTLNLEGDKHSLGM